MPIKMGEAGPQTSAENISSLLWYALIKERREATLVHLAGEEIEPCLQLNSFDRAGWGSEFLAWNEIGNVLDDRRAFSKQRPIIEHKRGHVSEWVHASIVAAARDGLRMLIDLDGFECKFRFVKNDVGE